MISENEPAKTDHDIEQLFLVLLWVGVLHRLFFVFVNVLMHCDDVNAYDFKCFFTDGGNGSVSIAYTLVRRTMVRQHNSCSDRTGNWSKRKNQKLIFVSSITDGHKGRPLLCYLCWYEKFVPFHSYVVPYEPIHKTIP